jgi:hypothetical protein
MLPDTQPTPPRRSLTVRLLWVALVIATAVAIRSGAGGVAVRLFWAAWAAMVIATLMALIRAKFGR